MMLVTRMCWSNRDSDGLSGLDNRAQFSVANQEEDVGRIRGHAVTGDEVCGREVGKPI